MLQTKEEGTVLIRKLKNAQKGFNSKKGFTLAELLVAIVVMSILSICVYLITSSASQTFQHGQTTIAADDVKDLMIEYVRQIVKDKEKIRLVDDIYPLTADGRTKGEKYIAEGNLLFSFKGIIYIMDSNIDGDFPLITDGENAGLPLNARPLLGVTESGAPNLTVYGNYRINLSFEPLMNVEGKALSVKIRLVVWDSTKFSDGSYEVSAIGEEVIHFYNMENKNGKVQTDGTGTGYNYCFYA